MVEGSLAYPSYHGRAIFSYISLQNLANRLHEKQKVGSAGRVTRLAGSPFFNGRDPLSRANFSPYKLTLARLAGSPHCVPRSVCPRLRTCVYLTIIPRARVGYEMIGYLSSHPTSVSGIIVLLKTIKKHC